MPEQTSPSAAENAGGDNQPKDVASPDAKSVSQPGFFLYVRDIVIAGILATGLWVLGEHLRDQGYVKAAHVVNFLACSAFFSVAPVEALKLWKRPVLVWSLFLVLVLLTAFLFFALPPKTESNAPLVSPTRIRLATDREPIRTSVTIYNPDVLPAYEVMLRIRIDQPAVRAHSLIIDADDAPTSQAVFKDNPVNVFRIDAESATNTHPNFVYFRLGLIPAKSNREIRISGSVKTNAWADLSVVEYKKNLFLPDWKSNVLQLQVAGDSAIWKDAKRIKFFLTNVPYGGILFTNGNAMFTNLPRLSLAIDAPGVSGWAGTNQMDLTNDFIFLTNNSARLTEITGLLIAPSDPTNPCPTLNLRLVNAGATDVTNIDVILTAMAGRRFTTNEFWHSRSLSNAAADSMTFHSNLLPVDRSCTIPSISFGRCEDTGSALIGVCINANDMPQQFMGFWLTFIPTNVLSRPFFTRVNSAVITSNIVETRLR